MRALRQQFGGRSFATAVLALLVSLGGPAAAQEVPEQTLDQALDNLSAQVARYLKGKGEESIVVSEFKGPPRFTSSGPLIKQLLRAKLRDRGFKTDAVNAMTVLGEFRMGERGGRAVFDINASLKDKEFNSVYAVREQFVDDPQGAEVKKEVTQTVTDEQSIVQLGGPNVDLVTGVPQDLKTRDALLNASLRTPEARIDPGDASVLPAAANSPYQIQILVKEHGEYIPRPLKRDDSGFAVIDMGRDEEFVVRLINRADHDVAVRLTIDGLNAFEFSRDYREQGLVIIAAQSSGTVRGWHVQGDQSHAFLITDRSDSAVAKLGRETGDMGRVTAMFFAAWEPGKAPPGVEPVGTSQGDGDLGVGFGDQVQQRFKQVKRHIGPTLLAAVSIRYSIPDDLPVGEAEVRGLGR